MGRYASKIQEENTCLGQMSEQEFKQDLRISNSDVEWNS